MKKSIYLITGVLALSVAGLAISQDRGPGRGMRQTDTDNNGITFEEYTAKAEVDRAA